MDDERNESYDMLLRLRILSKDSGPKKSFDACVIWRVDKADIKKIECIHVIPFGYDDSQPFVIIEDPIGGGDGSQKGDSKGGSGSDAEKQDVE